MLLRKALMFAIGGSLALAGCAAAPEKAAVVAAKPVAQTYDMGPYRWSHGHSGKALKAMEAQFGKNALKPGQFLWAENIPAEGSTRVIVDLLIQRAYVYRGDQLVGVSSISSGKRGKQTPLGIWPVLEKKKFHRSRKYDNAPMPFMQRLDQYGIAMHGGANPGFPASHGCVRLPMKFAEKLYGLTKVGSEVVIEG